MCHKCICVRVFFGWFYVASVNKGFCTFYTRPLKIINYSDIHTLKETLKMDLLESKTVSYKLNF